MGTNSNEKKKISTQKSKIHLTNTEQINNAEGKSKMDLSEADKVKKIWSFEALMQAMEPSTEELEYRNEKSGESDFVQKYSKLFKCTKCQLNIKPIVVKQEKVPTHPCLGVLMCQKCCDYYEDGEFSLDSDGEDKYCRWCGEGGTIFSCSKCISGFCASCIKQHFKMEYFKKVQKDENWLCFFCNPKPLWDLRFICSVAIEMSQNPPISTIDLKKASEKNVGNCKDIDTSLSKLELLPGFSDNQNLHKVTDSTDDQKEVKTEAKGSKRKRGFSAKSRKKGPGESPTELKDSAGKSPLKTPKVHIYSSSSDESDSESPLKRVKCTSTPIPNSSKKLETDLFDNTKSNALSELRKILSLSEHQMGFGISWSRKKLEKLATPNCITSNKEIAMECQKIKKFLSILSSFLVQFSNSVDSVEKTLYRNDGQKVPHDPPNKDQSAYTNILQFLGFVRGQVKTFMEKGISLPDVLEAEVYDDDKIIGIKKKSNSSNVTASQGPVNCSTFKNSESSENMEQVRLDDDILELVRDQKVDFDSEVEDDFKDHESSNTTLGDLNELKGNPDPKEDIREILAILENA